MINLLPLEKKEKLLSKKRKTVILIFLILVFYFICCLILVLFSIKMYSQITLESQKILFLAKEQELDRSKINNFQEKIKKANIELERINVFYNNEVYISEILEKIAEILPKEIYLTNFSAKHYFEPIVYSIEGVEGKEFGVEVSLSGLALNRETLIWFKKELEKEEKFTEIYFPLTNLVESNNIDFSLTFKAKQ